jgi:hypothetical protein
MMVREAFTMNAAWTRLTLDPVRPSFAKTLREAQDYCFPLRRVQLVSTERYEFVPGRHAAKVVILVPPELIAIWQAPGPGELSVESIAASAIMELAEYALEDVGKFIPF